MNAVSLIDGESLLNTMKSLESQNASAIRDDKRPTIQFDEISRLGLMLHAVLFDQRNSNFIWCCITDNVSLILRKPYIMIKDSFLSFDIR